MIEVADQGIDYLVFGGRLRSQLPFPDLSTAPGREAPDRELYVRESVPPRPLELLGTHPIEPGWVYHLHRVEGGLRLDYGATGSYGIESGGRSLAWYPDPDSEIDPDVLLEMARAILLGPVMALALQEEGILCLHGSAVAIDGRAAAFLAPKYHGKSTLALALSVEGARLLTDDLVAIAATAAPPVVLPGIHSVRLWADVTERLGERFAGATVRSGFKATVTDLPRTSLAWRPARLDALYVVRPVRDAAGSEAVRRDALPSIEAAAELAHGKKLMDELVGMRKAGATLEWIGRVVTAVPVYRLQVVRDLDRLPEVVERLLAWHANPGPEEGSE